MDAMTTPVDRHDAYAVLTAPIVILVGHFGSGKSEIALNLAFGMRERGRDVSGVDLGAKAFGAMSDLVDPARADLLFVVNTRRPFAGDQAGLTSMLREVEAAAHARVTGLVANTHLMEETTPEIVRGGLAAARQLSASTGIPVRFCAVLRRLG